jgi:hypothetical protein
MSTEDRAHLRLKALELAHGILVGQTMTMAAQNNWDTKGPTTAEVLSEAMKLIEFIEG